MVIQHNLESMFSNRQLNITTDYKAKSAEKLASGYKINRAADDAAGLSISEKLRKSIRGLNRGENNIYDGISYCQVADGALHEVHDMINRMKELAIQAANGTNSDFDRRAINNEIVEIKNEMDRIFSTTTFNEERIWDGGKIFVAEKGLITKTRKIPYEATEYSYEQFIEYNCFNRTANITNDNRGVWPYDKIYVNSDENGMWVKWTGLDGGNYQSDVMEWPDNIATDNTISFKLSEHLSRYDGDTETLKKLEGFSSTVVIDINTTPESNLESIINVTNNLFGSCSYFTNTSFNLYGQDGSTNLDGVSCIGVNINYTAALKANMNMKDEGDPVETSGTVHSDTSFIEADTNGDFAFDERTSNAIEKPSKDNGGDWTGTWKYQFNMQGIGKVIASLDNIVYGKNTGFSEADRASKDARNQQGENVTISHDGWWYWNKSYYRGYYQVNDSYSIKGADVNVNDVIKALTESPKGGLLYDADGDNADKGYITFDFLLTADNEFQTSDAMPATKQVGELSFRVDVNEGETVDDIIERINQIAGIDIYTGDDNSDTGGMTNQNAKAYVFGNTLSKIREIPYTVTRYKDEAYTEEEVLRDENGNPKIQVIGKWKNINVHTVGEANLDVKIDLEHRNLDVEILGLKYMNVLTVKKADEAMGLIDKAGAIISEERARFGAYQNRLEHAQKINANSGENLTAGESRLRDTDMADEMVHQSMLNILGQAGQSMLAQANQSTNGVMSLLQ